jgi:hypothetical protein
VDSVFEKLQRDLRKKFLMFIFIYAPILYLITLIISIFICKSISGNLEVGGMIFIIIPISIVYVFSGVAYYRELKNETNGIKGTSNNIAGKSGDIL